MKQLVAEGTTPEHITPELISERLNKSGVPPVDLIIRTSGEHRLSNFMMWESAYSELIFRPEYWPDFSPDILDECLLEYTQRKRRFGV
jgi:undecaprenyl diphosphate synthase